MTTPVALDNPLCVALDFDDAHECRRLAAATEDHVGAFKVGLTAFAAAGGALVAELAERRAVFCDLKLHDIPAQVAGAVREVAAHGAALVSVHASGGADMVRAAVDAAGDAVEVVAVGPRVDRRGRPRPRARCRACRARARRRRARSRVLASGGRTAAAALRRPSGRGAAARGPGYPPGRCRRR
jgi:orotidine-5'-phosphate decarboxylase